MTETVENYYEKTNQLFKPTNALKRNKKRLDRTTDEMAIKEILTNCIEHLDPKNKVIRINIHDDRVEFWNSMTEERVKNIDFRELMEKLTTFNKESKTNLNEGLCTLLRFKARIDVGDISIVNRQSEDGYYQYIGDCTHYIGYDGIHINPACAIPNRGHENGWKVTIYKDITQCVDTCLKEFIFVKNHGYQILYNDTPYNVCEKDSLTEGCERKYCNGYFFCHLEPSEAGEVRIYWRVNNALALKDLGIQQFNNMGASGYFILTDVGQFVDENRIGLHDWVSSDIKKEIKRAEKQKENEEKLKTKLRDYDTYRENYIDYTAEVLGIKKSVAVDLFRTKNVLNFEEKEKLLIKTTEFILRLKYIVKLAQNITIQTNLNIFQHPDKPISEAMSTKFKKRLKTLGLDMEYVRKRFPDIQIGYLVYKGHIKSTIYTGNIDPIIASDEKIYIISWDLSVDFYQKYFRSSQVPLFRPSEIEKIFFIGDFEYTTVSCESQLPRLTKTAPSIDYEKTPYRVIKGQKTMLDWKPKRSLFNLRGKLKSEAERIDIGRKSYFFSIFEKDIRGTTYYFPFLFQNEDDVKYNHDGIDVDNRIYISRWRILVHALDIMMENMDLPFDEIYPVFFCDDEYDHFVKDKLLAINTKTIPTGMEHNSLLIWFIKELCHIMAHKSCGMHGQDHQEEYEKFFNAFLMTEDKHNGDALFLTLRRSV